MKGNDFWLLLQLNTEKELSPQSLEGSLCNSVVSPWAEPTNDFLTILKYRGNAKYLSQAVVLIV